METSWFVAKSVEAFGNGLVVVGSPSFLHWSKLTLRNNWWNQLNNADHQKQQTVFNEQTDRLMTSKMMSTAPTDRLLTSKMMSTAPTDRRFTAKKLCQRLLHVSIEWVDFRPFRQSTRIHAVYGDVLTEYVVCAASGSSVLPSSTCAWHGLYETSNHYHPPYG